MRSAPTTATLPTVPEPAAEASPSGETPGAQEKTDAQLEDEAAVESAKARGGRMVDSWRVRRLWIDHLMRTVQRYQLRFGDRLAVIGFTALQGQWSRAGQPSQPLAPLPPNALEARALAAGAAGDAAGCAYLDRAALRSIGSVPSRLFGKTTTTDWSTAFDGVLVIRDEAAPTFESRR